MENSWWPGKLPDRVDAAAPSRPNYSIETLRLIVHCAIRIPPRESLAPRQTPDVPGLRRAIAPLPLLDVERGISFRHRPEQGKIRGDLPVPAPHRAGGTTPRGRRAPDRAPAAFIEGKPGRAFAASQ